MTQIASPLQRSKYPPFLPYNFYEAPQYASFRPTLIPRLTDAPPSPILLRQLGTAEPRVKVEVERKTLRTYMFDEAGRLQDAKINLETGEVTPHEYKRPAPKLKARRDPNAPDQEPFWTQPLPELAAPEQVAKDGATADKSRKRFDNATKVHLENYARLDDALEVYPGLDNILTGALALSMFMMLQALDVISPTRVRELMGYSKSHSEKVAMVLRVIVTGFVHDLRRRREC
jgi:hypothetical protein